ncbi:hypothetical protein EYZ11_013453 [Aspergillus tanneri]|uniref:Uncharacterized protein n=1 Tax=Aspergillus tanneri TaxID=1220188 RepID=A0A4S3IY57_9EURO|nr:hypothetical protein EYZ11_013453 [Aspergillus tanneri]
MHISLDNISFYHQPPPAKSPPCAFPVSCWKPYQAPPTPQSLSHLPPRPPAPSTTTIPASGGRPDAAPQFRVPAREDYDLPAVHNEFDIEIERIAMAENSRVMREADLEMHLDRELQKGNVIDVPQSQRISLTTVTSKPALIQTSASDSDENVSETAVEQHILQEQPDQWVCPSVEAVRDLSPTFTPAGVEPEFSSRHGRHLSPGINAACACTSPSPSPGLLDNVPHPRSGLCAETIQYNETIVENARTELASRGDQAGDLGERAATMQSIQNNSPFVREASPDNCEKGQAPALSHSIQQNRPIRHSKIPPTHTRSLRPRRNAKSTRLEQLPSVSKVIPVRRSNRLMASSSKNPLTRARRRGNRDSSDSDDGNNNPAEHDLINKARERPRKRCRHALRPKKATESNSGPTTHIVGECTSPSQKPSDGGFSVALGETQEIFGRGILQSDSTTSSTQEAS